MSRSYKKTPVCKDQGTRWMKCQASKAVRRYAEDIGDGGSYKKLFCSYNICDYRTILPYRKALHEWITSNHLWTHEKTFRDFSLSWQKDYKRK